jgi:hypothetical protein
LRAVYQRIKRQANEPPTKAALRHYYSHVTTLKYELPFMGPIYLLNSFRSTPSTPYRNPLASVRSLHNPGKHLESHPSPSGSRPWLACRTDSAAVLDQDRALIVTATIFTLTFGPPGLPTNSLSGAYEHLCKRRPAPQGMSQARLEGSPLHHLLRLPCHAALACLRLCHVRKYRRSIHSLREQPW